jgi:predicted RNA-binding Zn ribbon-like protein
MNYERSQAIDMRERREAEIHRLIGGDLCLDFANTLNGHAAPRGHEYLHDYRDLVFWARHADVLTPANAKTLLKMAIERPSVANGVYRKALALRETIFRIFTALANGSRPANTDLDLLNAAWKEGQRHSRLARASTLTGFVLCWDDEPSLESILRRISASAVNLLISENAKRIGRCAGEGCDWLFINASRNHLRRWCSMDECGNRAKMRRRQARKRFALMQTSQQNT